MMQQAIESVLKEEKRKLEHLKLEIAGLEELHKNVLTLRDDNNDEIFSEAMNESVDKRLINSMYDMIHPHGVTRVAQVFFLLLDKERRQQQQNKKRVMLFKEKEEKQEDSLKRLKFYENTPSSGEVFQLSAYTTT